MSIALELLSVDVLCNLVHTNLWLSLVCIFPSVLMVVGHIVSRY